jgi:HK97 family phage major capsid protein
MPDALLTRFLDERAAKVTLIESYKTAAADEGRDLTESEQETIGQARSRIAALDAQLDLVGEDLTIAEETSKKLRSVAPFTSSDREAGQYRSAGHLLYDVLHLTEDDAARRYHAATKNARAAQHMGTLAANTTATAGDLAGLYVDPVVGPVINPYPQGMPFATALGLREMPAGDFRRPYIVDPNGPTTGVDVQTAEKAELASLAFTVANQLVEAETLGGYLNVSQQLLRQTPQALDVIVSQMNWRLARAIDIYLVTELAESTGTLELDDAADAATIYAALFDASAEVFAATGELATWILMGPLGWARLGGLTDDAGRPLFPYIGGQNGFGGGARADSFEGSGPAGLRPIVTPAITDASFWVGNSLSLEGYIYRYPVLEAVEPSVLGRQIAVAADIAAVRPTPTANSAVHIEDTVA